MTVAGYCNASPDLRQQINSNSPPHPKDSLRHSPIFGVVLTNGDNDHVAGLLSLRESSPLVVSATTRVHAVLRENSVFNVLNPNLVQRLEEAPKDVIFGLEYIKRKARTPEQQQGVIEALMFKTDLLWAQLDALHFAYVEPGLIPPGAFVPEENG